MLCERGVGFLTLFAFSSENWRRPPDEVALLMQLFLGALEPWLMYIGVGVLTLATAEECALLWLLPEWTPDVRGLYWILKERAAQVRA